MKRDRKNMINRKIMSGILGRYIDYEIQMENYKPNDDTVIRRSIQNDIIAMIKSGKGKIETFDYLWNKYKESKYCMYISQWYEYHHEKLNSEKTQDKEER